MFTEDPKFDGVFLRNTFGQIMGAGGLWSTAKGIYPLLGGKALKTPVPHFTFPSGSMVRYQYCANETDAEAFRGLQLSFLGIDEITQMSKEMVTFLLSCLRSEAKNNSFCLGTCNPSRNSWVYDLVSWYLDDNGYVIPERNGKIRFYVVVNGDFIFADEEGWFLENMPETVTNSINGDYIPPKKFAFQQLTIMDNPPLLKANSRYLSELQNLPKHERDAQLYGCWHAMPDQVNYFNRAWVRGIEGERVKQNIPMKSQRVRAWDKAGTEFVPAIKNYPDFTACAGMAKDLDGFYYIYGDFHPDNHDRHEQVFGKFRKGAGERDAIMLKQAVHDGADTKIVIAQDAGADGKQVYQDLAKKFTSQGFIVKPSPMATNKSKLSRYEPFCSAAQAGLVYIVESSFPDKRTLEQFYLELENFDGQRSTGTKKDDVVDSISDCFNYLSREQVIPSFSMPDLSGSNRFGF